MTSKTAPILLGARGFKPLIQPSPDDAQPFRRNQRPPLAFDDVTGLEVDSFALCDVPEDVIEATTRLLRILRTAEAGTTRRHLL
ncbi:hypothetical protein RI367_000190 [Sorochytrium milnesiophthora]